MAAADYRLMTEATGQRIAAALEALSGFGAYLTTADVVNNLTSTATDKPLSAAQGKALNDKMTRKTTASGTTTESGALLVSIPIGAVVVALNVTSEQGKIALKRSGSYVHIYTPSNSGLAPYANANVSVDIYYQLI